jgi:hypothetical protein
MRDDLETIESYKRLLGAYTRLLVAISATYDLKPVSLSPCLKLLHSSTLLYQFQILKATSKQSFCIDGTCKVLMLMFEASVCWLNC